MALDYECLAQSRPLTDIETNECHETWQTAFSRWRWVIESENVWSRITGRIRELNDPLADDPHGARFARPCLRLC